MSIQILYKSIKSLLQNDSFLTQADIAKKLKKDKVRVSGYLEALADLGHISVKKAGNAKDYFLVERGK